MRNHLTLLVVLALTGCMAETDLDGTMSATAALEGTREGYGVLRLLNDGEGTTFDFLDVDVALDRRAAENLIAHRDGPDTTFGTADDDLFDTILEVDQVSYVGPATLDTLAEFALLNDYVPGDNAHLGTYDGVDFTYLEGERVIDFVNDATEAELREASVPSRGVTSILEARPLATVEQLAGLYYIGTRTLEHLKAAVAEPVGGEPCRADDECAEGLRCVGRSPDGLGLTGVGKCRDITNYPGVQDACEVDSDCNDHLICIAGTVYEQAYCASEWMRDSFHVGGQGGIPPVVMTEPTGYPVTVYGQASVPEDIIIELDIEHSDPSSLWIGLQPPTGQEPVTLFDGATQSGPVPSRIVDRAIYRDDSVNGTYTLLIQNVGGRGEGTFRGYTLTVTSRWD